MAIGAWTAVVAALLVWAFLEQENHILTTARMQARMACEKDQAYRRWNFRLGGLYAPVTETSPPNPHLASVPERDIATPSGRQLTLINAAYMVRQVHEISEDASETRGHITSLRPIRAANAPDPWESAALQTLGAGQPEISSLEQLDGLMYLRLMRPLRVEQACLKCHADQGYRVGDIGGGVSVSVPMEPLWAAGRQQAGALWAGHSVLWLVGLIGIARAASGIRQKIHERQVAEEQLAEANARLEQANRRLSELATTDELTGLWNRRWFIHMLEHEVQRSRRYGTSIALVMFDIDHFKTVNDTLGHAFGDLVLADLAHVLRAEGRATDVVARYGGEEFMILMPDTAMAEAVTAAERIRRKVADKEFSGGKDSVRVTVSAGVGAAEAMATVAPEILTRLADEALYDAKRSGRNRTCTRGVTSPLPASGLET